MSDERHRILEGVRVLDLSHFLAGPYCAQILGDIGAEVIRIEPPGGEVDRFLGCSLPESGDSFIFISRARGKKAITLNLQTERGRQILRDLVKRSDVVVEAFGAKAKRSLGVDYASLREAKPSIVLVAFSAYGLDGPFAEGLGNDAIAQSASGIMSYTGFPGDPPLRLQGWVDYVAGTHGALGAISALYHRKITGVGQQVDVSLLDAAVCLVVLGGAVAEYALLGKLREQDGNSSPVSFGDAFKARDGWVTIATMGRAWHRFARAIGRADLIDEPRFKDDWSRHENREVLRPIVAEWLAQRTCDEVTRVMDSAQVPCAKVNTVPDVIEHPQVKFRHMVEYPKQRRGETIPVNGPVLKFSETPALPAGTLAPGLGEHNQEIYGELLGYSAEQMARLQSEGII